MALLPVDPNNEYSTVALPDFAAWAASKHLTMPPELAAMAPGPVSNALLGVVMDESHPEHAPELAAAIRAWIDVSIGKAGNQSDTIKNRVIALAKKQGFVQTAAERIGSICTPGARKKGGRR